MQSDALSDIHLQVRRACHDLNAPLRAVRGFADILQQREAANLSSRGQLYLQRMVAATGHMERVVEGLHQYGRLATHRVQMEPVKLHQFTDHLLRTHYPTQQDAIQWQADPDLQWRSDPALLQTILCALLDNALRFRAPDSSPEVELSWQQREQQLHLTVRDHGIGIEAAHHQRIFHLFERMHNREQYPGAGTGLTLVWKAVSLLGGTIALESAPDRGTTVTVSLPAP